MANTPNINLVKPLGTDKALVSVINDNSDKIDAFAGSVNTNMANTQDGFAIVVNGNNAPKAITAGQYLFIKNHSTLSAGGYHATANIANGAAITSSNVAADADGVVNGAFSALNSKLSDWKIYTKTDDFGGSITSSSTLLDILNAMQSPSVLLMSPGNGGFGSISTLGAKCNGTIVIYKWTASRHIGFNMYGTATNATSHEGWYFRAYQSGDNGYDAIIWSDMNCVKAAYFEISLQNVSAGSTYALATIANILPSGGTYVGAVLKSVAGINDNDYGYLTSSATMIYYKPTTSQSRIDLKYYLLYI